MKGQAEDLESRILEALGASSHTTSGLAALLLEPRQAIYYRCRRLQDAGEITSTVMETGQRLIYCLDCGEVVVGETYQSCKDEEHELRSFPVMARLWHASNGHLGPHAIATT